MSRPRPGAFNADVISKVSATDESTVQITTPKPDPPLPLRVASLARWRVTRAWKSPSFRSRAPR